MTNTNKTEKEPHIGLSDLTVGLERTLPCPFCGNADISGGEVLTEYPSGKITTQSMCRKCGALGAEAILEIGEIDYGSVKANKAWNMRSNVELTGREEPNL